MSDGGAGVAGDLRAAVRRCVDAARGNCGEALPAVGAWLRPHLRSPECPAFIQAIEHDLGPFAGPTLRALVADALTVEPDATRALHAAYERINHVENRDLAATVDRERRNLMAGAVYRLVRQEADAWKRRSTSGGAPAGGNSDGRQR